MWEHCACVKFCQAVPRIFSIFMKKIGLLRFTIKR